MCRTTVALRVFWKLPCQSGLDRAEARPRGERLLAVVPLGLALVAGAAHAAAPEPQWLVDARAKEGVLVAPHLVTSADKSISFSVPAPMTGALAEDKDAYTAVLTLAPGITGECVILKTDVDPAAFLRATARITFTDTIEKVHGKIEMRAVEHVDAGMAGPTPYLSASWIYRANDGTGARIGGLRQYVGRHAGHSTYCALNDIGYAETFAKVALAVIGSLKASDDPPAPYFEEISVVSIGDARVGFGSIEMHRDADGDTKSVENEAMIVPGGAGEPQTFDSVTTAWVTPAGALINLKKVSVNNGEVEINLDLQHAQDTGWVLSGKFKSKDVQAALPAAAPSTWVTQTNLRRELLARESPSGAEAVRTDWLSANPGEFTTTTVKVLAAIDANSYLVRETFGPASMDLAVDRKSGQSFRGTMEMGPVKVTATRVFVRGSP